MLKNSDGTNIQSAAAAASVEGGYCMSTFMHLALILSSLASGVVSVKFKPVHFQCDRFVKMRK